VPNDERQLLWTQPQASAAVKAFLATAENIDVAEVFASDLAVFSNDERRRRDGQAEAAQRWWESVCQVVHNRPARLLTLAEPLAQYGITLNELYAQVPWEYHPDALKQAIDNCRRLLTWGVSSGITNTRGWSDARIRAHLEQVKTQLEWANTTGSARKWWEAFEKENSTRLALVLHLAEQLAVRKATVTEFFLAYVYSNIENIQGNLCYLDYTRVKKEEERKKGRGPPVDPGSGGFSIIDLGFISFARSHERDGLE
jgi:hypothetical protein